MTQYFEIEQRDGAARIGKLLLSPELRTPCILNTAELGNLESPGPVVDAGSFWGTESRAELEARVKPNPGKSRKRDPHNPAASGLSACHVSADSSRGSKNIYCHQ